MSKLEGSSLATFSQSATPISTPRTALQTDFHHNNVSSETISRATSVAEPRSATAGPNELPPGHTQLNGFSLKRKRVEIVPDVERVVAESRKRSNAKGRTPQEEEATAQTASRVAARLAADQTAVLNPDVDTPFQDALDVVKRLLPYHIYLHPADDLASFPHGNNKGKKKATEEDLLREEIAETKFALECWKRRRALENRFRRARVAGAQRAPDDMAYVLTQAIVEADRAETALLNQEARTVKQELDKLEREKRAAAAAAAAAAKPPPPPPPQRPATYYPPPPPASTSTTTQYSTQYRPYTYPYGQGFTTQYTYNPYAANPASSPYNATAYQQARAPVYSAPMSATTAAPPSTAPSFSTFSVNPASKPPKQPTSQAPQPSQNASTPVNPAYTLAANPASQPIPVQMPITSISALTRLGIVPVPAADAPPPGQPQPPAVVKGTTQDGAMICLEINVSSLQAHQMSGLAVILSTLTSRGVNVDGSNSAGGATAASTSSANATDVPGNPTNTSASSIPAAAAPVAAPASAVATNGQSTTAEDKPPSVDSTSSNHG
ncbi:hypothetical protein K474DRAFT_1772730 [Panus rudis PR-1116 ss-1]|nr:hypothetical protein K474DRAFT_1772730 [Panus rudis PR-1116 ss-1]